jgi:hypothetical protein
MSALVILTLAFFAVVLASAGYFARLRIHRLAQMERAAESLDQGVKAALANIVLFAETLQQHGQDDPGRIPEFAGIILEESTHLWRLLRPLMRSKKGRTSQEVRGPGEDARIWHAPR